MHTAIVITIKVTQQHLFRRNYTTTNNTTTNNATITIKTRKLL